MASYLVLTVIGDDKPGLVESLAKTIAAHSGNWLESNMSQLAGKFAGILRVSVADDDRDALIQALKSMPNGLKLIIEQAASPRTVGAPVAVQIHLVANDRPGIIKEIAQALAAMGINVESLITTCAPAPMTSSELFTATAILNIPPTLEIDHLKQELEKLADDMIVEIEIT
jgi:glycine cleavage system regulatory protein